MRLWPRTAAIAERLWSRPEVCDVDDLYRRLPVISFYLEHLGLQHRKNYPMMLRRLTGDLPIEPLAKIVDYLEPVKIYTRHRQGVTYTSYSPLTRVVDAAPAESMTGWQFRRSMTQWLQTPRDSSGYEELKSMLQVIVANQPALERLIERSPVLWEIRELSMDFARLAARSLEAMQLLSNGNQADANWMAQARLELESARQPRGQLEISILPALEALIEQATAPGE